MRAYYFGCYGQAGHCFWEPGMRSVSSRVAGAVVPWGLRVDGGLAPKDRGGMVIFGIDDRREARRGHEMPQGVAALHHRDGWTALSFWDRTGDRRGNSSSTFLLERGDASFEEMVEMARDRFPRIIDRLTFPVVPFAGLSEAPR